MDINDKGWWMIVGVRDGRIYWPTTPYRTGDVLYQDTDNMIWTNSICDARDTLKYPCPKLVTFISYLDCMAFYGTRVQCLKLAFIWYFEECCWSRGDILSHAHILPVCLRKNSIEIKQYKYKYKNKYNHVSSLEIAHSAPQEAMPHSSHARNNGPSN